MLVINRDMPAQLYNLYRVLRLNTVNDAGDCGNEEIKRCIILVA